MMDLISEESSLGAFDIYSDILTNECKEKEVEKAQLKADYEETLKKLEALQKSLEAIQTENQSLTNQNTVLKRNITTLFQTAKTEIKRKDTEIARLRKIIASPASNQHEGNPNFLPLSKSKFDAKGKESSSSIQDRLLHMSDHGRLEDNRCKNTQRKEKSSSRDRSKSKEHSDDGSRSSKPEIRTDDKHNNHSFERQRDNKRSRSKSVRRSVAKEADSRARRYVKSAGKILRKYDRIRHKTGDLDKAKDGREKERDRHALDRHRSRAKDLDRQDSHGNKYNSSAGKILKKYERIRHKTGDSKDQVNRDSTPVCSPSKRHHKRKHSYDDYTALKRHRRDSKKDEKQGNRKSREKKPDHAETSYSEPSLRESYDKKDKSDKHDASMERKSKSSSRCSEDVLRLQGYMNQVDYLFEYKRKKKHKHRHKRDRKKKPRKAKQDETTCDSVETDTKENRSIPNVSNIDIDQHNMETQESEMHIDCVDPVNLDAYQQEQLNAQSGTVNIQSSTNANAIIENQSINGPNMENFDDGLQKPETTKSSDKFIAKECVDVNPNESDLAVIVPMITRNEEQVQGDKVDQGVNKSPIELSVDIQSASDFGNVTHGMHSENECDVRTGLPVVKAAAQKVKGTIKKVRRRKSSEKDMKIEHKTKQSSTELKVPPCPTQNGKPGLRKPTLLLAGFKIPKKKPKCENPIDIKDPQKTEKGKTAENELGNTNKNNENQLLCTNMSEEKQRIEQQMQSSQIQTASFSVQDLFKTIGVNLGCKAGNSEPTCVEKSARENGVPEDAAKTSGIERTRQKMLIYNKNRDPRVAKHAKGEPSQSEMTTLQANQKTAIAPVTLPNQSLPVPLPEIPDLTEVLNPDKQDEVTLPVSGNDKHVDEASKQCVKPSNQDDKTITDQLQSNKLDNLPHVDRHIKYDTVEGDKLNLAHKKAEVITGQQNVGRPTIDSKDDDDHNSSKALDELCIDRGSMLGEQSTEVSDQVEIHEPVISQQDEKLPDQVYLDNQIPHQGNIEDTMLEQSADASSDDIDEQESDGQASDQEYDVGYEEGNNDLSSDEDELIIDEQNVSEKEDIHNVRLSVSEIEDEQLTESVCDTEKEENDAEGNDDEVSDDECEEGEIVSDDENEDENEGNKKPDENDSTKTHKSESKPKPSDRNSSRHLDKKRKRHGSSHEDKHKRIKHNDTYSKTPASRTGDDSQRKLSPRRKLSSSINRSPRKAKLSVTARSNMYPKSEDRRKPRTPVKSSSHRTNHSEEQSYRRRLSEVSSKSGSSRSSMKPRSDSHTKSEVRSSKSESSRTFKSDNENKIKSSDRSHSSSRPSSDKNRPRETNEPESSRRMLQSANGEKRSGRPDRPTGASRSSKGHGIDNPRSRDRKSEDHKSGHSSEQSTSKHGDNTSSNSRTDHRSKQSGSSSDRENRSKDENKFPSRDVGRSRTHSKSDMSDLNDLSKMSSKTREKLKERDTKLTVNQSPKTTKRHS